MHFGEKSKDSEDLGQRNIQGVDAVGVRRRETEPQDRFDQSKKPTTRVIEIWCSQELSAVVSRNSRTEEKPEEETTGEIRTLRLVAPDPGLFEIPTGYRVVDRFPEEDPPKAAGVEMKGTGIGLAAGKLGPLDIKVPSVILAE